MVVVDIDSNIDPYFSFHCNTNDTDDIPIILKIKPEFIEQLPFSWYTYDLDTKKFTVDKKLSKCYTYDMHNINFGCIAKSCICLDYNKLVGIVSIYQNNGWNCLNKISCIIYKNKYSLVLIKISYIRMGNHHTKNYVDGIYTVFETRISYIPSKYEINIYCTKCNKYGTCIDRSKQKAKTIAHGKIIHTNLNCTNSEYYR